MLTLPTSVSQWLTGLIGGVVGGAATAGQSWLALSGAHAAGLDVAVPNFKALGIICMAGATTSLLAFLAKSPIPITVQQTTVTVKKEVTQE